MAGGSGPAQNLAGLLDLVPLVGGELGEPVAHLLGDAGEGADLGGEVIDHVVGGADRLGGLPVGAQAGDVLLEGGQVGRVGSVEAAAGALEADRAGATTGLDVGRFGAVAERHRHRGPLVGGGTGERRRIARGVDGQRPDRADGLLFALEADRVVAHRGGHGDVVHEFFEHVDRNPGIGVPLGVGIAQCVWAVSYTHLTLPTI